jgi:hypothetical protein
MTRAKMPEHMNADEYIARLQNERFIAKERARNSRHDSEAMYQEGIAKGLEYAIKWFTGQQAGPVRGEDE